MDQSIPPTSSYGSEPPENEDLDSKPPNYKEKTKDVKANQGDHLVLGMQMDNK